MQHPLRLAATASDEMSGKSLVLCLSRNNRLTNNNWAAMQQECSRAQQYKNWVQQCLFNSRSEVVETVFSNKVHNYPYLLNAMNRKMTWMTIVILNIKIFMDSIWLSPFYILWLLSNFKQSVWHLTTQVKLMIFVGQFFSCKPPLQVPSIGSSENFLFKYFSAPFPCEQ